MTRNRRIVIGCRTGLDGGQAGALEIPMQESADVSKEGGQLRSPKSFQAKLIWLHPAPSQTSLSQLFRTTLGTTSFTSQQPIIVAVSFKLRIRYFLDPLIVLIDNLARRTP